MPSKERRKRKPTSRTTGGAGASGACTSAWPMCLEVDYRCDDNFLFAYITDMSAMGIFIRTTAPEPPGTLLNLRFAPPDGPRLDVEGRVIWVNRAARRRQHQPGHGRAVRRFDAQQREQIVDLVRTFAYLSDDEEKIRGNS